MWFHLLNEKFAHLLYGDGQKMYNKLNKDKWFIFSSHPPTFEHTIGSVGSMWIPHIGPTDLMVIIKSERMYNTYL
jgi:hypothetical protein